jgi:hypothetical protein
MMKDAEKLTEILQQVLDRADALQQALDRVRVLQQALDRIKILLANIVLMTDAKNVHWSPVCRQDIWTLTTQELERLTDDR